MTTGKTIALTIQTFFGKVMSLLFNTLSRFVIAILPRSKHLLILWLQPPSTVIFQAKKMKSDSFYIFPIYLPRSDGQDVMIFTFWMLSFKPGFHSPFSPSSKGSLATFYFLPLKVVSSAYLSLLISLPAILIPPWDSSILAFSMMYSASQFSSVTQSCLFVTKWTTARHTSLSFTNSQSLLKLMSIESVMQSNHLILSSSSPTFNPSQYQGLFKWVSSSHQVTKYWSFSFSISPSNGYSGLISFRIDWLDLLAVQGTLKSLFQHHSPKRQFFSAQISL